MFPLKKKIYFTLPFKNFLIKHELHELVLLLKKVWQKIVITWMMKHFVLGYVNEWLFNATV
jgi:intracellular septation protein A